MAANMYVGAEEGLARDVVLTSLTDEKHGSGRGLSERKRERERWGEGKGHH